MHQTAGASGLFPPGLRNREQHYILASDLDDSKTPRLDPSTPNVNTRIRDEAGYYAVQNVRFGLRN